MNPDLNDDIYQLIEEAELDPGQESRLERDLSRQYHLLTRDDRLETVAQDIVRHFLGRGFVGKAMVVSIDKATALRMHDKVRHYWNLERQRVEQEIERHTNYREKAGDGPPQDLVERLEILKTTDLALIVSPGQNEVEQMKRLGLDIVPHRLRMNTSDPALDERLEEFLKLSRSLGEEQKRHLRENLTQEELVIFDILTRPSPELTPDERAEVKRVAKTLLQRVKLLLVLNWRQKASARSQLRLAIEDELDTGLPRAYEPPLYQSKCSAVFEHVYEAYPDRDRSFLQMPGDGRHSAPPS